MSLITKKCPSCGASLSDVDSNVDQFYCMYCGTLIDNKDSNHLKIDINQTTHSTFDINQTYRKIDEARIREAEINRELKLKELEQKKEANKYHSVFGKKFWIIMISLLVFLSIVIKVTDIVQTSKGKIKIKVNDSECIGENYLTIQNTLKASGFTNFELIDLGDEKDNNIVTSISIGGRSKFADGNYVYPDELVVITFH